MIKLGHKYKDRITGFQGVATGHVYYISGCNQTLLAPEVGADGAMKDSHWFDDQRMLPLDGDFIELDNSETPGCDRQAPKR